jgi:hypothetical protein
MRGKKRNIPGYHAIRGWFYNPVQKAIEKWDADLGRELTHETFQQVRRVMENGNGHLRIEIKSVEHRKFLCELLTALDDLHAPENSHGWVVKYWARFSNNTDKSRLLTYQQIRQQIIDDGGPAFTTDALKQAAKRLRLLSQGNVLESDEQSVLNPKVSSRKPR